MLWHLGCSSKKRDPAFGGEAKRREAVRCLAEVGGEPIAFFSFVFEHGHTLTICKERKVGGLRRSLRMSLSSVTRVRLEPLWYERIEGKNHARALVKYLATQVTHHNLAAHPALFSGSSFQDLVGARKIKGLRPRLEEIAPDVTIAEVQRWLGLPAERIQPANDDLIRSLGAGRLKAAATAALAADPLLEGKSAPVVAAKRTVAHLGLQANIAVAELAHCLKVTPQTVKRLAAREAKDSWLESARVRLGLEHVVLRKADLSVFSRTG